MIKKLKTIILISFLWLLASGSAFAVQSTNIYIGLENPATPTNMDKFSISFTALDILSRPLTVKCYKVNPDSSEVQLGADIAVKAGGNSGECSLENNPLTEDQKTYKFYAVASAEGDAYRSDTISVEFDRSGPGTPSDYSKEKIGNCIYKIKFTAHHDGNTEIIRIYRADVTQFIADSGSQIGQVGISPDQKGEFTDLNIPDCNKTYYYVIRAFDKTGNGSSLVGDYYTVFTSTTTPTITTVGAIPVTGSNIPGEGTPGEGSTPGITPGEGTGTEGSVLGSEKTTLANIINQVGSFANRFRLPLIITALVLLAIIGYVITRFRPRKRR